MRNLTRRTCVLFIMALCGLAIRASAASFDWVGGSGSNWTTAANWTITSGVDADGIPDADDDVRFPTNGNYAAGIDLNGDQVCNSLTFAHLTNTYTTIAIGMPGQTLTITSGSVTRMELSGIESENRVRCNVVLSPTSGTNQWNIAGDADLTATTRELRFEGAVTATVPIEKTSRGVLVFATTNALGSTPSIKGGYVGVTGQTIANALGTNDVVLGYDGVNSGSLYVRNLDQTIANRIVKAGTGTAMVASFGCNLTLAGDMDVPAGSFLQFGNSGSARIFLQNRITGAGSLTVVRSATFFNSTNQFTPGNIYVGSAGGSVVLDGLSWTTFTNWYSAGYGTGSRQWQLGGGGFAARTTPLVIAASGAVGGGADAKTWFDRTVAIGGYWDTTTRDYANQPVTVRVNTELTDRRDWLPASPGGGPTRTCSTNVCRFEGNITDRIASGTGTNRGALRISGNGDLRDELVLAGTNDWTGSALVSDIHDTAALSKKLNTGPGGLAVVYGSVGAFVQFDGNDSLPRGNGGSNAWLAAVNRYGGSAGFFLAAKPGGHTYQPRPGYKFILGTNPDGLLGASGPAGSSATLQNSAVCIHTWTNGVVKALELCARGPCEFVVGTPGSGTNGAVLFEPTVGLDLNFDGGLGGSATVVSNGMSPRTLRTRGDGTVVLRNAQYALADGTGDTHTQFVWQVGAVPQLGGGLYFDGAVRETGADQWNSTGPFPLSIAGGVLELGYTNFFRYLTNTTTTAGYFTWTYGGGFSAYGGPRRVNVNGGAAFGWNNANGETANGYAIVFGSRTANDTVTFENDISLPGLRTLATVRGTGTTPEGRITGKITGANALIVNGLTTRAGEPLPAGALELANTNNTYSGNTTISNGTLLVSGVLRPVAGQVNVNGGALGGTGVIYRTVNVTSNAVLSPGDLNSVGTLTVASNLTFGTGAIYSWDFGNGAGDRVVVGQTLTIPTNATVNVTNRGGDFPFPAGVLFSAGQLAGSTNDLSHWTLNGVNVRYKLRVSGNNVLLYPPPASSILIIR